eukprot:1865364-Amphidinium_carterae.1
MGYRVRGHLGSSRALPIVVQFSVRSVPPLATLNSKFQVPKVALAVQFNEVVLLLLEFAVAVKTAKCSCGCSGTGKTKKQSSQHMKKSMHRIVYERFSS